jgi:predicted RecA/RadA family phage recombinase
MKNFVQPGDALTLVAPVGGVTSGTPVLLGQLLVVPTVTAPAGAPFTGLCRGVFDVPKTAAQAWTAGALVYWNAGTTSFTTTAAGNRLAGCAAADAIAAATTGRVFIDGAVRANS